ncbi:hypothetical protein F5ESL0245_05250 [Lactobacillus sp. ESL0245]|nr:hypothetical protein F5ESL0247_05245 [Lactobacillus sp. ESL0247]RMC28715.1 hypothetical protein F5ESL0246_05245 [Lactobacillus sp. ESL0246]RMC31372.1 hypothetical protein F5ESL0245_05250 [Lactobacillus sp. ESL0245]
MKYSVIKGFPTNIQTPTINYIFYIQNFLKIIFIKCVFIVSKQKTRKSWLFIFPLREVSQLSKMVHIMYLFILPELAIMVYLSY